MARHYHRQKPDNQVQSIYTSVMYYFLFFFSPREYLCSSQFSVGIFQHSTHREHEGLQHRHSVMNAAFQN